MSNPSYQTTRVSLIPFTTGIFAVYAFFWPEQFAARFGVGGGFA